MPHTKILPPLPLRPHITVAVDTSAREAPYWVRGRNHEIAHIVRGFAQLPRPITVIAGAPGTGKSTLLRYIEVYAGKLGIHVIRLKRDDFETHATLADAIRGVRSGLHTAPDSTERSAEVSAKGKLPFIAEAEGGGRVAAGTSGSRPGAWRDALNQIGTLHQRGVLFTLDETQRMKMHLPIPDRATRVQEFMDEIHSESAMRDERPITLLCAGLSDSPTVLNAFEMTRIENNHTLRLGALSLAASHQILVDHITAPTSDGTTLITPPDDLIDTLVEDCGGCAHHLAWAGWRLQEQALFLIHDQETAWPESASIRVREAVDDDRAGLYATRMPPHTDQPGHEAACVLAVATERYGEQLPARQVMQVADAVATRHGQPNGLGILTELTHKGVIEHRVSEHQFLTKVAGPSKDPHYVFPVHSMATWATSTLQASDAAPWRRGDSERVLTELFGPPPDSTPQNGWGWDDSGPILPLPSECELPDGTATNSTEPSLPAYANPEMLTAEARAVLRTSGAGIFKSLVPAPSTPDQQPTVTTDSDSSSDPKN